MKFTRLALVAAVIAATAGGCIVRTPPCHTDCWWHHGHRVCARRC
jgi:hypothetical protein